MKKPKKTPDKKMTIPSVEARKRLSELINRAKYGGERIAITRRGKVIAYIVGEKDMERLGKGEK